MKTKISTTAFIIFFLSFAAYANNNSPLLKKPKSATASRKASSLAALTKNLEYDTAMPSIRDAYYANLDELAKTIREEDYAVSLRGHADSRGGYKYNWVLSDNRAISVKKYLVSKGVKEDRIITTPFGSTVPIATNTTAAGRQKNRRVEIKLKKINA